jgi:hypothetical protein
LVCITNPQAFLIWIIYYTYMPSTIIWHIATRICGRSSFECKPDRWKSINSSSAFPRRSDVTSTEQPAPEFAGSARPVSLRYHAFASVSCRKSSHRIAVGNYLTSRKIFKPAISSFSYTSSFGWQTIANIAQIRIRWLPGEIPHAHAPRVRRLFCLH